MKLIQSGVAVPQSRDSAAALQICQPLCRMFCRDPVLPRCFIFATHLLD